MTVVYGNANIKMLEILRCHGLTPMLTPCQANLPLCNWPLMYLTQCLECLRAWGRGRDRFGSQQSL